MHFRKGWLVLVLIFGLAACDESVSPSTPSPSLPLPLNTSTPNPALTPPTPSATLATALPSSPVVTSAPAQPARPAALTSHPRLWLKATDLPRLRSWAVDTNPLYKNGLLALATQAKAEMDGGKVPKDDPGTTTYVDYPTEMYAELFAFMSLVTSDPSARDDYAKRARSLLMYVIDQAKQGPAQGQPFRDPEFSTNDRSRWHGEGFALTVDWIYPYLTPADKEAIRQVFLVWAAANLGAAINGHDHPEPGGKPNDPQLVKDPLEVRWAGNNYWTAHMRNLGLMALALDSTDDPGNQLHNYLDNATGVWLYVFDYLLRHEARGGLLPEGFEYGPQTAAYALQFLLALHTAGQDDPVRFGPQVVLANNPFWNDFVQGYLHSLSPLPVKHPDLGQVYQPAWYGDGQKYWSPDFIQAFGPLGLYDGSTAQPSALADLRWIELNMAPGGPAELPKRLSDTPFYQDAILYFMLFDPSAPLPPDPRPKQQLSFYAPGLGRLLSRTGWDNNASWFTYKLSWNSVDHQNGDGNQFEFYRKGEWLTKERSGYDLDYGSSDNHNTLALENSVPAHNEPGEYRNLNWLRGSQWAYVSSGNPQIVAHSGGAAFEYVLGDATPLYNSSSEGATAILEASRSIIWLKPDLIVVYDRAESQTSGSFKRFWLNLPAQPVINTNRASVATASGQQLFVTTLLPAKAQLSSEAFPTTPLAGDIAEQEPMGWRLKVEAVGGPQKVQFLHVLEGADKAAQPQTVQLVESEAGTAYAGAVVKDVAVMFPVDYKASFSTMSYTVSTGVTRQYITGLKPNTSYGVTVHKTGDKMQLTLSLGGNLTSDSGGVLVLNGRL